MFTSTLNGAPGAARWGLSQSEWETGRAERDALWAATEAAVIADRTLPRTANYEKGVAEVGAGTFEQPIYIEATAENGLKFVLPFLIKAHYPG